MWILWPRGSDKPTSQPQSKRQQPQSTEQQPQAAAIVGEEVYPDNKTGLMWTIKDNRIDITWHEADQYCRTLNLAAYQVGNCPRSTNWRNSTIPKAQAHTKSETRSRLTSSWVWSSNMEGPGSARTFGFYGGRRAHDPMVFSDSNRAFVCTSFRKMMWGASPVL